MKFLTLLCILFSITAFAERECSHSRVDSVEESKKVISTDVPNHLKGAKIIVRLADGRESEVPAEKFKVVPRKQEFIVTHTLQNAVTICKEDPSKNRIAALGGYGTKEGLDKTVSGSQVDVKSETGAVGGLQYQRMLGDTLSIGVQGQTNKTTSLILGIDF